MSGHLAVAVRAWASPVEKTRSRAQGAYQDVGPSPWTLVVDTETTTDLAQRLRVGSFQVRRGSKLRQQGFFYDPEALTQEELTLLGEHCRRRGLALLSRDRFVHEVFFRVAIARRGQLVGFNLPFDLSRLAIRHERVGNRASATMRDGFTFWLDHGEKPTTIQIKRIGPRSHFIRFSIPKRSQPEQRNRAKGGRAASFRGYVVDVGTFASAVLGHRGGLGALAQLLGTATPKGGEAHGQALSAEYLDYALADCQVTYECFRALEQRYRSWNLPTPVHQVYSEASIGKGYLKALGVKPWGEIQPDAPDWLIAAALQSYYGGRTECHIRRTPVPGVYLDFASQYPTVFALMGLWKMLAGQGVDWEEIATGELEAWITQLDFAELCQPETWTKLAVLVQVAPDGDYLPTRARYAEGSPVLNVAIAERVGGPAQWYTLADAIASRLATGTSPRILRALAIRPRALQQDLTPITLAGDPRFRVDPARQDVIRNMVELRRSIRAEALRTGDQQLEALSYSLKVAANATCYGIPVEVNVTEHAKAQPVRVQRPDGSCFETTTRRTEAPGRFFHPLIATLVTGGGRLLLAMAMDQIARAGGTYAFCDTDSLFVVATRSGRALAELGGPGGGGLRALSWAEVDRIRDAFASLNPYDPELVPGSILECEGQNFDAAGEQREVWAYAVASKRYALFTRSGDRFALVDDSASAHGLGHLLPPDGDPVWHKQAWRHIIATELGTEPEDPEWFSAPAIGRITVSSPHEAKTFAAHNRRRTYANQVRPFNFLQTARPDRSERARRPGVRVLVAPFGTRGPRQLWRVRHQPEAEPLRISTADPLHVSPGAVRVETYGEYLASYVAHPELKAAQADGRACSAQYRGVLMPRPVEGGERLAFIGKESNRLAEDPEVVDDPGDQAIVYAERVCACRTALVGKQRKWCSEACRKRDSRRRTLEHRY